MQLLASYPYLRLYLHEGVSRAIEAQWQGHAHGALLRRATLECVNLAREHRVTGWIADDRLLGPLRPADVEWTAAYVLPLLVKSGLRRFARLEAVDPLTQRLLDPIQETAAQQWPFDLRSFTDVLEAREWACG
ncbi:MAG: hypothetical protein JWR44_1284 [Hymenobacter sp.]|jgi:hypothetical protein|nr:hypothetical protein [Hymenobacter sp.]